MSEKNRILVVDDDLAVTEYMRQKLGARYSVITANSPADAMRLARAQPPDLILCDVDMPAMSGYQLCRHFKGEAATRDAPVMFLTAKTEARDEARGFVAGGVDYVHKRLDLAVLEARIETHLMLRRTRHALKDQNLALETLVAERTTELEASREALRESMHNLRTTRVTSGVFWVQVPEVGLYILCGSPADVVKHLMLRGYIAEETKAGVNCETGPNVILLSDVMVQNGGFANLAEFPVLQMLYRQGMILPGHPNNTGRKPMLIGSEAQVRAQLDYIYRGNYGLVSEEELRSAGLDAEEARRQMALKMSFAFGKIRATEELLDYRFVGQEPVELVNDVWVRRVALNRYEFRYRGGTSEVDLNLKPEETYESPYAPGHHVVDRQYFGVIHSGEGDGWDLRRQSMSSIVMFMGRYYLVDAGPMILHTLRSLGIDVSEVEGIFHTHAHDDHFAGLPALIASGHRIKYFATPPVRHSVTKKLAALMSIDERLFAEFFEVHDLKTDVWNDCDGMEVMPMFSPHPVENSIYMFRVRDAEDYLTYAHWADIVSLDVLKAHLSEPPASEALPKDYLDTIRARYLTAATLKKIDAGGGMIHGNPVDFASDASTRIVLAHRATAFSRDELEIGSQSSFGAVEILIPSSQDYLRQRAYRFLSQIFPDADIVKLSMLSQSPVQTYNAGSLILRRGFATDYIYLLLTGTVEHIPADSTGTFVLATGSFLGERALFEPGPLADSWRAASAVRLMCFSIRSLRAFLDAGGWNESLRALVDDAAFLGQTWLFGGQVSFITRSRLARARQLVRLAGGAALGPAATPSLYLVREGELQLSNGKGRIHEVVGPGGFVGEESFLSRRAVARRWVARGSTELFEMAVPELRRIPIVLWKLLETYEKRLRSKELGG